MRGGGGVDGVEGHVSLAADGGVAEAEGRRGGEIVLGTRSAGARHGAGRRTCSQLT